MRTVHRPTRRRPAGVVGRRLAAGMLVAGLIAGCTGHKKGNGLIRLTPRAVPLLDGVAVPNGFKIIDKLTDAYESGGVRFARHEYVGSADLHAIRRFYREQMPLLGWNRVSDQNVKGRISIRFEKKHEDCTVEIERGGMLGRATIQVIVKPFNRTPSEPPKRPVP